ncbi:hypothetical protein [Brevundimonas sp. FT23028]|uniref:hypothetical protein n=1 Tax=Brevundimonas sp. FT23028 TaxID=3393748 RepID=UPI003B58A042
MTEARDGGADIEAVFRNGLSGYGKAPYLTTNDLLALSERCLGADRVICNIEAFEIDGEHDVARLDLSLHGETPDQKLESWSVRAQDSHRLVGDLVRTALQETNPVMFAVWLDWAD